MKSSLLVASVLFALATGGQARAETSKPAYAPIQITAPNGGFVAAGAVTVVPVAPPAQAAPTQAAPAKPASTKPAAPSKDAASVADLRRAEADFKATAPAAKPAAPAAKPAAPAANPAAQAAPAAKPATPAAKPAAAAPAPAKAPQAKAPSANTSVIVQPAHVTLHDSSANAQLPSIRPGARASITKQLDAAAILTSRCATLGKHTMKCMNLELSRAENEVDSVETKLMNCRELRKFDKSLDPQAVDGFVTSRMYQLRLKATQGFNAEIAEAGQASRLKTAEIELRATIGHLNAVAAFTAKVCSAPAFNAVYAKAASAQ